MAEFTVLPLKQDEESQTSNAFPDAPAFAAAVAIVSEYLKRNSCPPEKVPGFLADVHESALQALSYENRERFPVVMEASISDDYLVCLEDGKKVKNLAQYLKNHFNLTPEEYREKWRLPENYPMISPALSRRHSAMIHRMQSNQVRPVADDFQETQEDAMTSSTNNLP